MTEQSIPEVEEHDQDNTETTPEQVEETPEIEPDNTEETPEEDPQTFPREYVEKLRSEAAEHRIRAKRADDYAARLHTALVAATGRLADPDDLPYDEAHLEDAASLEQAIDDLLTRRPHLASRRVTGTVGQGATDTGSAVDLAGLLRARA